MAFRDSEVQSNDERIRRVELKTTNTLPVGFAWVETTNSQGEVTVNLVHVDSGRVVLGGF